MARSSRRIARRSSGRFPSIPNSEPVLGGARRPPLSAPPFPPEIVIVERFGSDEDGVPLVRPIAWTGSGPAPNARVVETSIIEPLASGARAAAQLISRESGEIDARIIRVLGTANARIAGVFRRDREGGRVTPADRRKRVEYRVAERDIGAAEDGDLVTAELFSIGRLSAPRARVVERLGHSSDVGVISLLAIANHDIPTEFP